MGDGGYDSGIFLEASTSFLESNLTNSLPNDFSIRIFPNPVIKNLTINFKENNFTNVKILNYLGQKLYEDKNTGQHKVIDMSSFNNGVYFLRLETSDHKVITKKLIKQ
ncbi:MAG: T9SS type A sorting domain-containing protein [Bacteroidetes bacterium]|nr:T9SS type A sorting domain-containing protein [Bacteroidota bacterium]